ncbi:MAG: hypothetical protein WAZ40_03015 [Minisyncoccia bacterium]
MDGTFIFDGLLGPILVAILIIVALQEILKITKKMAGSFGAGGAQLAGTALGVATGGAALLGQKTIGRYAREKIGQDNFKAWAAKSPIGRVAYNLTDKASNATFDARNAPGVSNLGLGKGGSGSFVKTVKEAKEADVAFAKKISTGADGKAIKTTFEATKEVISPSGEKTIVKETREGTTAEAYKQQLEKGYISRMGTGGNIGAAQAAKEVGKNEEKRQKLDKNKNTKLSEFKTALGLKKEDAGYDEKYEADIEKHLDSDYIKGKEKALIEKLEEDLARADTNVDLVKELYPNDVEAITEEKVKKKKAEKALKKFEGMQTEIKKIKDEIDSLKKDDKGADKKEKEEKH